MTTGHSGCPSITELMRRQPRPTRVCRKRLCTTSVSGPTCTLVSVIRLTTYLPVLDACSTDVAQWYLASAAMSSVSIMVIAGRAADVSCFVTQVSHKLDTAREQRWPRTASRRSESWQQARHRVALLCHSADMSAQCGLWGSTAACTEKLADIVRAGARHLLLNPMFDDLEHLERLAQEVMPYR
jgi:hypothetical protein